MTSNGREFSDDAKRLMCGIFAFGRGTVKSHPPHETVGKYQSAFDELIAARLITKEPFNRFDIWLYKPTELLAPEANKHRQWYFAPLLEGATAIRTPILERDGVGNTNDGREDAQP